MSRLSRFAVALVAVLSTASLILGSGTAVASESRAAASEAAVETIAVTAVAGTPQTVAAGMNSATLIASVSEGATTVGAGRPVTFTVTSGPATFPLAAGSATPVITATAPTNDAGQASAPALTVGPTAGTVIVTATTPGATTAATFTLTVTGVPSTDESIAVASGQPVTQSAQSGQRFAPLVATVTKGTEPVPAGTIVTFTVTTGSATFPSGITTTATTNAQGRAEGRDLTAGLTSGPATVTATTPGASSPGTYVVTVTPAPAPDPDPDPPATTNAITQVSGGGQSAAPGSDFGAALVARVSTVAPTSTPVGNQVVTFTISSGTATFADDTATATATTNDQGTATSPLLTAGETVGQVTVTASAPNAVPTTFILNVGTAPGSGGSGEDMPGGPNGEEVNPDEEVDQTEADGSEAAAGGDQVEEVPLGSVDTGGWS